MKKIHKLFLGVSLTLALCFGFSVYAYANTTGIVTGEVVNVRSSNEIVPGNRVTRIGRGERIKIHGAYGDFFRVTIDDKEDVYIAREWVQIRETHGVISAAFAWAYCQPGESGGRPAALIREGERIIVTSSYEDWYGVRVGGSVAFIRKAYVKISDFIEDEQLPTARVGNAIGLEIARNALNYLGTQYVWGGTTPNGFDCSGFMIYLFTPHGVTLNRRSTEMARNGEYVPKNEISAGDMVFFSGNGSNRVSHVGLYIGSGQFIHSSTFGVGVIISNLSSPYNVRNFVTARRVI